MIRPQNFQSSTNKPTSYFSPQAALVGQQPDIFAEQVVFWTLALLPLWWILGIQVFVYPLVGWYLLLRSLQRPNRVSVPFGWQMWCVYIGFWILSLLINLALGKAEVGRSVTAFGSITGIWTMMVGVWYAMRRLSIRHRVIIRALCIVGLCQLVAVILGEAYLKATGSIIETHSLIVTLIPSIPSKIFFDAALYGKETLVWDADPIPRLKSFYYWSPLAGTMSIFICTAAMAERQRFWQVTGFLGGLVTAWFAAARAGQVAIVVGIIVALWFGEKWGRKLIIGCAIPIGLLSPIIISELYKYFFEYRKDSAAGRLALYDETYKAFLNSPLIGFGAQGRSAVLADIPLGSHSQLYSTLYQTGIVGSSILAVAWIAIALSLLQLVRKQPTLSPVLGAWVGLTLVMPGGELAAASVTVFTIAAWLGCAWNQVEQATIRRNLPWLVNAPLPELPTPWEIWQRWWSGSHPYLNRTR
jgi:O-Antigen ligase